MCTWIFMDTAVFTDGWIYIIGGTISQWPTLAGAGRSASYGEE